MFDFFLSETYFTVSELAFFSILVGIYCMKCVVRALECFCLVLCGSRPRLSVVAGTGTGISSTASPKCLLSSGDYGQYKRGSIGINPCSGTSLFYVSEHKIKNVAFL